MVLFLMRRLNAVGKIMLKCVGEQGFMAVRETVHLVKFIGNGCSIFFSSAYVSGTTGYKILQYSSRIHMVYLPHNNRTNLYNFRFVLMLVCFSP